MAKNAQGQAATAATAPAAEVHVRAGWTLLALGLAFGVTLEALEAFRVSWVVADAWRNRLWSLAHFHADAMGLLNLVYRPYARGAAESRALAAGSALIPVGFVLGGLAHSEGDPGLGILLVPVGATLVISVAVRQAIRAWRKNA
ncbi:MAG TPA: hypothetical protein VFA20_26245 [Myxococcaceae bacterium]|nr:hypothetical protein [Myxococcaceae bacterium]